jgi:hypothetical protein
MSLFTNIIQECLDDSEETEVLEEKIIKVKHMKQKQKAMAKRYRMKNKRKMKLRLKRFRMKTKNKRPARKGWAYGADAKLHKKVMRKGVRKSPHHKH